MSCNFLFVKPRIWGRDGQPSHSHCFKHSHSNSEENNTKYSPTLSTMGVYLQGCDPTITLVGICTCSCWKEQSHADPFIPTIVFQPGQQLCLEPIQGITPAENLFFIIFCSAIGWLPSQCTCSDLAHLIDTLDTTNLLAYCKFKFSLALSGNHF